ncbi:hypothetical protein AVEN_117678-1 [Araneus ventricosus]|uniref:Reverse transcriptase domain-containing protein n=1 Tax=Araneus ventricosus TaxID=182803 RepID=A0A4Y2S1L0_ARAVE|nr:hypothetical protein AVEN_83769-1 [Araneus ventricosus]GBN81992.1 hypothetical protein AVEN_117678-1 [Araneus ventricosus]
MNFLIFIDDRSVDSDDNKKNPPEIIAICYMTKGVDILYLGPLLFILFINDLTCIFKYSGCLLFADNLKLFGSIRSDLDSVLLQRDLDCLFKWCIDNRLHLNIEKCNVLSYTRKAQPLIHVYKINNPVLSRSNTVTNLGIIFDSKLDFSQHIDTMVSKHIAGLDFLSVEPENFPVNLPSWSCVVLIFVPIWNTAVLSGIPITETKLKLLSEYRTTS